MKKVGDKIRFGKRGGTVVSHATFKRHGHASEVNTYYIVELDDVSHGYLEPIGYSDAVAPDTFISLMLIHVGNEDD